MHPKNRKAELLLFFIENNNSKLKSFSYLEIAQILGNNNVHKYRRWLEEDGVWFTETKINSKNRYGRPIEYKRFKLSSTLSDSKKIFERINK